MENDSNNIKKLIEVNVEASEGYQSAADNINDSLLSTFLSEKSVERKEFAEKLIKVSGIAYVHSNTLADLHRVWMDLKASSHTFHGVDTLKECRRGEKHALNVYKKILDEGLASDLQTIAQRQIDDVQSAIDKIDEMIADYKQLEAEKKRETPVP